MKKILLIIMLSCATASFSYADVIKGRTLKTTESFASHLELEEWMTNYYRRPDPGRVVPAIKAMFDYGVFDEKDASATFGTYFLSFVFQQNQNKLEEWYDEADDNTYQKQYILWMALGFPKYPGGQELLNKLYERPAPNIQETIKSVLDAPDQDLLTEEVEHPGSLEALWGTFFATGDERYIQRIISYLGHIDDSENSGQANVSRTAKEQLTNDAGRHRLILDICKKEEQRQTGTIKEVLGEIIAAAGGL